MPPITRLHSLDGLRGIAALFVAVYHFSANSIVTHSGFVAHGWLSVDLFFVISGIVLDRRYFANPDATFAEFAIARLARMMPLYYIMLALFIVLDGAAYVHSNMPAKNLAWPIAVNFFALQSFGLLDRLWFYGPSWSISAEIWVNLLLFPILLTSRYKWALGAIIAIGLIAFLTVVDIQSSHDFGWLRCFMGIAVGIIVSRIVAAEHSGNTALDSYRKTWGSLALSIAWVAIFVAAFNVPAIFSFSPLLFGLLCYLLVGGKVPHIRTFFSHPTLTYLGKISFSVYMTHFFVGGRVIRALAPVADRLLPFDILIWTDGKKWGGMVLGVNQIQGLLFVVAYLAATIIVAHLVMIWIEIPLYRRFKRRLSTRFAIA